MAKQKEITEDMLPPEKSFKQCVAKIRKSIKARTGAEPEPWLDHAIEGAAMEEQALRHYHRGVMIENLTDYVQGSTGQMKKEANVMIPHRDKSSRTHLQWLTAIGLTYDTTPSKVKEDTKRGVDTEKDGLSNLLTQARDTMNEIPEID